MCESAEARAGVFGVGRRRLRFAPRREGGKTLKREPVSLPEEAPAAPFSSRSSSPSSSPFSSRSSSPSPILLMLSLDPPLEFRKESSGQSVNHFRILSFG